MIINAAREIIAEKGLKESKISDIAQKAGVVDSIIYYYFKNKEDMLFWCLDELMKKSIEELDISASGDHRSVFQDWENGLVSHISE